MKCIFCGGKTIQKNIEYKEFGILLGHFSAEVCEKCNETFFDEKTAEKIQKKSRELGLFGLAKRVKIAEIGNSIAIRVPKEISNFLNLKKGEEVTIYPETKKELRIHV